MRSCNAIENRKLSYQGNLHVAVWHKVSQLLCFLPFTQHCKHMTTEMLPW